MDNLSRHRFRYTMLAILVGLLLCLAPKLKDLGREKGPDPKELAARERNRQGLQAIERGDWDLAITRFDEAIRSYNERAKEFSAETSNIDFHSAVSDRNRFFDGMEALHNLIDEINSIRLNRGSAYQKKGEHGKAIDDFSAVIRWTSSPKAYELRAESYHALGDETAANKDEEMAANFRANISAKHESSLIK